MKTINKFLLEKLIINKHSKSKNNYPNDYQSELVKVPVCDYENQIVYKNKIWKELELPTTKYVLYKDKYRGNCPHFNDTSDFIINMCAFQDDFEDFNPAEDILYASNDLQEILGYYFKYYGITEMPNEDNLDEWSRKYKSDFKTSNDNLYAMGESYCGLYDYYQGYKEINYKSDLENILKSFFDIKE